MELMQIQGVKVRLLDLKRGDIRPGLANLRNNGIQNFIVDIGAEYLEVFFEEVSLHFQNQIEALEFVARFWLIWSVSSASALN